MLSSMWVCVCECVSKCVCVSIRWNKKKKKKQKSCIGRQIRSPKQSNGSDPNCKRWTTFFCLLFLLANLSLSFSFAPTICLSLTPCLSPSVFHFSRSDFLWHLTLWHYCQQSSQVKSRRDCDWDSMIINWHWSLIIDHHQFQKCCIFRLLFLPILPPLFLSSSHLLLLQLTTTLLKWHFLGIW